MDENPIYYVYVYLDPRKPGKYHYKDLDVCFLYEPIYVGKGKGNRYLQHLYYKDGDINKNNNILFRKIRNIKKEINKNPIVMKYQEHIKESVSFDVEKSTITNIGRLNKNMGPLANLTDGGDGASGMVHNERTRKIISENNKKYNILRGNPFKGKHHTDENKERIRLHRLLQGNIISPEGMQKLRDFNAGEKNNFAKSFKLISPHGEEFIIKGNIKKFCSDHNICYRKILKFKNKGKVWIRNKNYHTLSKEVVNTDGWSMFDV